MRRFQWLGALTTIFLFLPPSLVFSELPAVSPPSAAGDSRPISAEAQNLISQISSRMNVLSAGDKLATGQELQFYTPARRAAEALYTVIFKDVNIEILQRMVVFDLRTYLFPPHIELTDHPLLTNFRDTRACDGVPFSKKRGSTYLRVWRVDGEGNRRTDSNAVSENDRYKMDFLIVLGMEGLVGFPQDTPGLKKASQDNPRYYLPVHEAGHAIYMVLGKKRDSIGQCWSMLTENSRRSFWDAEEYFAISISRWFGLGSDSRNGLPWFFQDVCMRGLLRDIFNEQGPYSSDYLAKQVPPITIEPPASVSFVP
ncbi:MAG: hypothetical protein HY401_08280 [Elusimicrobia bacterium]|nr:hypothetical protein [Elusimicrobiota bacterium]